MEQGTDTPASRHDNDAQSGEQNAQFSKRRLCPCRVDAVAMGVLDHASSIEARIPPDGARQIQTEARRGHDQSYEDPCAMCPHPESPGAA
jgi:hypothetical protein